MRGKLFEIATNMKDLGDLDADFFITTRDGSSYAEWYEDTAASDRKKNIKVFRDYGMILDDSGEYPILMITEDCKKKYFEKRYEEFITEANRCSIEVFSSSLVQGIQRLIEDDYDDAVYLAEDEYAVSMDEFIRRADPETKYYLGNIILMH